MFRVTARVQEYNAAGIALLKKLGFTEEVRRRQALDRDGCRWDLLVFGLLKDEWQNQASSGDVTRGLSCILDTGFVPNPVRCFLLAEKHSGDVVDFTYKDSRFKNL